MKGKTFIILVLGILFSCSVDAQDFNWEALNETSNRLAGKLSGAVFYMPPDGNSKHFYHDKWVEGSIVLEDGDKFDDVRLRYLAYGDELVVYNPNLKQLFIVDKETVAGFDVTTDGGTQKFIKLYFNGFFSGDRYFEQLYNGKRQLLAFRYIEKLKSGMYKDNLGRIRNTRYKLMANYYMYSPETGFKRLRPRRKSVLSLFPERKKELRRLIRRSGTSVKNETGLVRVFGLMEDHGFFQ